jgi:hypothetical protein
MKYLIPQYEILSYDTLSVFPVIGNEYKIYLDLDTEKYYRYNINGYEEIIDYDPFTSLIEINTDKYKSISIEFDNNCPENTDNYNITAKFYQSNIPITIEDITLDTENQLLIAIAGTNITTNTLTITADQKAFISFTNFPYKYIYIKLVNTEDEYVGQYSVNLTMVMK